MMIPHHTMHQNTNGTTPVMFRKWLHGTVCNSYEFLNGVEVLALDELDFNWEYVKALNSWALVQQVATISEASKWHRPEPKKEEGVTLLLSEGMLERVNKILKKKKKRIKIKQNDK